MLGHATWSTPTVCKTMATIVDRQCALGNRQGAHKLLDKGVSDFPWRFWVLALLGLTVLARKALPIFALIIVALYVYDCSKGAL